MNVEELGEIADVPPDQAQMIADMRDAADRITTIVRDLSSLARPGSEELTPVALVPVIDGAARLASYKFDANVVLDKTLGAAPPVMVESSSMESWLMFVMTGPVSRAMPALERRIGRQASETTVRYPA